MYNMIQKQEKEHAMVRKEKECFGKGFEWLMNLPVEEVEMKERKTSKYEVVKRKRIKANVDFCYLKDKRVYRVCHFFPCYAVSEDGKILNLATLSYQPVSLPDKNSYLYLYIYDYFNDRRRFTTLHRLVAMTWIPNNDYVTNYVVDHIDGNKQNTHFKNLRWTSMVHNSSRVKTPDKVYVRDMIEGVNYIFTSLSEAASFIGYPRSELLLKDLPKCVGTKDGKLYYVSLSIPNGKRLKDCIPSKGIVVNIGGTWRYHHTIDDLNKDLGTTYQHFSEFKRLTNYTVKMARNKRNVMYYVKDVTTGKIYTAYTRKVLTEITGIPRRTIDKIFKNKKFNLIYRNKWVFSDNGVFPDEKELKKNVRDYTYILEKDGKKWEFGSLREAARFIGITHKTLKKHLNGEINGYMVTLA